MYRTRRSHRRVFPQHTYTRHSFGNESVAKRTTSRSAQPQLAGLSLSLWLSLLIFIPVALHAAENATSPDAATSPTLLITLDTIIPITYEHSLDIAAAKYDLEAAEYAFKEFERELSQFTPLMVDSSVSRHHLRSRVGDERFSETTHYYDTRVGAQKEFFNGSSIFLGAGHHGEFTDADNNTNPFTEADIRFPLFGSYTTLSRVTERAFEENQLFNTRLEYVDTVRNSIEEAQTNYFWLQVMLERVSVTKQAIADYEKILALPCIKDKPAEQRQVTGECISLNANIASYEGSVNSYRVYLKSEIGLENLPLSHIGRMDLYAKDYYGKSYVTRSEQELLAEAERNDVETRVLENAKKNSEEKRRLAQKGKWDIFLNFNGAYDYEGSGSREDTSEYQVSAGVEIKLIDPGLLGISLKKAEAEIRKYESQIAGQQLEIKNDINVDWVRSRQFRNQIDELMASVASRRKVYEQKLKDYTEGKGTIDNLIQARKDFLTAQIDLTGVLGNFYEATGRLDSASGVYFQKLGITIPPEGPY
jgi:outer membrane protein TolC